MLGSRVRAPAGSRKRRQSLVVVVFFERQPKLFASVVFFMFDNWRASPPLPTQKIICFAVCRSVRNPVRHLYLGCANNIIFIFKGIRASATPFEPLCKNVNDNEQFVSVVFLCLSIGAQARLNLNIIPKNHMLSAEMNIFAKIFNQK